MDRVTLYLYLLSTTVLLESEKSAGIQELHLFEKNIQRVGKKYGRKL
jgi:hypothetical protein